VRVLITILISLLSTVAFGQTAASKYDSSFSKTNATPTNAVIHLKCSTPIVDSTILPLIVVDGVPREYSFFKKLDSNQIESITILKESISSKIISCNHSKGVILITLKCQNEVVPVL
jgi:hypothetical protein